MSAHHRIPVSEIESILDGTDLVALVARRVKLVRRGSDYEGICPFHKERTPSFKVSNSRRRYHCFGCGADGDAIRWLQKIDGLSFVKAVHELQQLVGEAAGLRQSRVQVPPRKIPKTVYQREPDLDPRAERIWIGARPIAGTLAETYLRDQRGITIPLPTSLRFSRLTYEKTGTCLPCMVAAVQRPDRRIIAVQVTFLTERGAKADVAIPRWTYGALGSGAVRLSAATHELGFAEGTEKALAAIQLTGVPCWSTVGAPRLPIITIPEFIRVVHIFGDNDDTGRKYANTAAERHTREGRKVFVRYPPPGFKDYDAVTRARALGT